MWYFIKYQSVRETRCLQRHAVEPWATYHPTGHSAGMFCHSSQHSLIPWVLASLWVSSRPGWALESPAAAEGQPHLFMAGHSGLRKAAREINDVSRASSTRFRGQKHSWEQRDPFFICPFALPIFSLFGTMSQSTWSKISYQFGILSSFPIQCELHPWNMVKQKRLFQM